MEHISTLYPHFPGLEIRLEKEKEIKTLQGDHTLTLQSVKVWQDGIIYWPNGADEPSDKSTAFQLVYKEPVNMRFSGSYNNMIDSRRIGAWLASGGEAHNQISKLSVPMIEYSYAGQIPEAKTGTIQKGVNVPGQASLKDWQKAIPYIIDAFNKELMREDVGPITRIMVSGDKRLWFQREQKENGRIWEKNSDGSVEQVNQMAYSEHELNNLFTAALNFEVPASLRELVNTENWSIGIKSEKIGIVESFLRKHGVVINKNVEHE